MFNKKKKTVSNENNQNVKVKKMSKLQEKLDMYDMILANLYAGKSIIEPRETLNNSQIKIDFSTIASAKQISKYFTISAYPDYIQDKLIDDIRNKCMEPGVKIDFYFYANPYTINWDSTEMRNRMRTWQTYSQEYDGNVNIFNYRKDIVQAQARERIIKTTKYLNESEVEYKRSILQVIVAIKISAYRDPDSLADMADSVKKLKSYCNGSGIKLRELRINMIDFVRALNPFSLNASKETNAKLARKLMTDDNLANFNSYKQGRVGLEGIPLGVDVLSYSAVLRKFKSDPDKAENWLISAETGGGKSMWVKSLLAYMLADGYTVCIMDYEGDEYTNLANYVRQSNPDDVKVVSMGKGSAVYFDPCEIPELTGDPLIDDDLKESAINFITAIYRIITHGVNGDFTTEERKILGTAIQRMYDSVGVTDDKTTWHRSRLLKLHDVYHEIKEMVITKEYVDSDNDNIKHKAAQFMLDAAAVYFEEGEVNSTMFAHPMSANELYKAKLIVFSFGMKGVSDSASDPTILALKQLSVAYVNIQISNYCKYVKHYFNVKVWEEFQRWGVAKGSSEVISNVITGGRKRGDVNFVITNDLSSMLDEENELAAKIGNNIQNYAIGKINKRETREKFCEQFDLQECQSALDRIAKAGSVTKQIGGKTASSQNRYKHAFCVVLDDGNKTIVKSMLPQSVLQSSLYKTGVQIE